MCVVRAQAIGTEGNEHKRMRFTFENNLKDPVLWPTLVLPDGSVLREEELVWTGRPWVKEATLNSLGLKGRYLTAKAAKTAFNRFARDSVGFEFTVRGYRFLRQGNALTLLKADTGLGPAIDPTEQTD